MSQSALVKSLCTLLRHGDARAEVLETHISFVVLAGGFAYKIKKAISLPFLDFSTLALRRFYCEEELRLNRRFAPDLYLAVVPIGGTAEAPVLDSGAIPIEYAVKMRAFPQDQLASRLLARGELQPADIDVLAAKVAAFHRGCATAGPKTEFGSADGILHRARDNFTAIRRLPNGWVDPVELNRLEQWTGNEFVAQRSVFEQRKDQRCVRECHGDLHLGNIARVDGALTFFDCIEFSDDLRWIDVINEAAFLAMDLAAGGRCDYAHRFVNAYLEAGGDYAGLAVVRFYAVYRALVRAMVLLMRIAQAGEPPQSVLVDEFRRHFEVASAFARPPAPALFLMHGLSGSGKTAVAQVMVESLGAVRLRSDVERKRLVGLESAARSVSPIDGGLYAGDMTQATYETLQVLARTGLRAGFPVIVDATFMKRAQRQAFAGVAHEAGAPFAIVSLTAPEAILRERILARAAVGIDASEASLAVLDLQMRTREAFAPDELSAVVTWDATRPLADAARPGAWTLLLDRLRVPGARAA